MLKSVHTRNDNLDVYFSWPEAPNYCTEKYKKQQRAAVGKWQSLGGVRNGYKDRYWKKNSGEY
jgi:hypothetical protein